MARRYYANNAPQRTLAGSLTSGATTLTVSGTFAGWPVQYPFYAALDIGTASFEIVSVTNIVGSVATIVRGQDGTSAISHPAGATVDQVVVRQDLDEASAHINATSGAHGISGSFVGTSDVQTLTNKTYSGGTMTGAIAGAGATVTGHTINNPILTGTMTGAGAINTTGAITTTQAVAGASFAASGNGAVSGVVVPKSYTTEAAATAALGAPTVGTTVWLTAPTTGPAGLFSYLNSTWTPVGLNPPTAQLYQTAAQAIGNAAFTAITWDTEALDTHNAHDLVTNPSRYTASVPGWYQVFASVAWAPNATGRRITSVFVTGVEVGYLRGESVPTSTASSGAASQTSGLVQLAVGDYIEIRAFQSSGGSLNTVTTPTNVHIRWVHA